MQIQDVLGARQKRRRGERGLGGPTRCQRAAKRRRHGIRVRQHDCSKRRAAPHIRRLEGQRTKALGKKPTRGSSITSLSSFDLTSPRDSSNLPSHLSLIRHFTISTTTYSNGAHRVASQAYEEPDEEVILESASKEHRSSLFVLGRPTKDPQNLNRANVKTIQELTYPPIKCKPARHLTLDFHLTANPRTRMSDCHIFKSSVC